MTLTHHNSRRPGFSLVELLVVISIIAVLMGLIVPAIFGLLGRGTQLKATEEIKQMQLAVQAFQTDYKVKYMPSRIALAEKFSDYSAIDPALAQASITYLAMLWTHIADSTSPWKNPAVAPGFIDWNGNGVADPPVLLEGDQCLVFFLGGIPVGWPDSSGPGARVAQGGPGIGGFSANQRNPSHPSGRKRPYYEFKADKLKLRPTASTCPPAAGYYSYYDPYSTNDPNMDKPYAYFSSNGVRNKYNPQGDCPTIHLTAVTLNPTPQPPIPFAEGAGRFHNPDGYQIISAGADRVFGWPPTGIWTPATADQIAAACTWLNDDQSNFYGQLMGVGQ